MSLVMGSPGKSLDVIGHGVTGKGSGNVIGHGDTGKGSGSLVMSLVMGSLGF